MRRILVALAIFCSVLSGAIVIAPATVSAAEIICEDGGAVTVSDNATAEEIADACGDACSGSGGFLGFPTWYKYLDIGPENGDPCAIIGPTKDGETGLDWEMASGRVALAVIEIMLRIATLVAIAFVIIGGIRYITSQGEPDNAKSARQTITNALIGLVISLLAAAIVAFVANRLTS
jgi:hypothetical protein